MIMKRVIIGTIAVIFFAYGLATGEFWQDMPAGSLPNLTIEKVLASEENPDTSELDEKPDQDKTIFSWSTIALIAGKASASYWRLVV